MADLPGENSKTVVVFSDMRPCNLVDTEPNYRKNWLQIFMQFENEDRVPLKL